MQSKDYFKCEVFIYTIPLSVYHLGFPINSFTSSTIFSATPFSSTTDDRGRRRLGNPKGLHSAPRAVYITVRPSSCFKASSRAAQTQIQVVQTHFTLILMCHTACSYNCRTKPLTKGRINHFSSVFLYFVLYSPSWSMLKNICLSLPKAVNVTDSHGVPVCRSTICFSLVLSTRIHFRPYLKTHSVIR